MKKISLCLFSFLFVFNFISTAQNCSALQFTFVTAESRCMATGSAEVFATGGSGNYNYRVIGPVTTPYTSNPVITGLHAGRYALLVKDVSTGCIVAHNNVVVSGSYSDPDVIFSKTDVSSNGNDGSIYLFAMKEGRAPFTFSIIAPSPSQVGATNTSGYFQHLVPGGYSIQLRDSCGSTQVRQITIGNLAR